MQLRTELLRIAKCLKEANIDYALCGGLAVAVHGYPRMTKDIDILVVEQDLSKVLELVAGLQYDLEGGLFKFNPGTPNESQMFRVSCADGHELVTLDLLIVSPALIDVWKDRERVGVDESEISVVSLEGLIRMKELSGRPQDVADIHALKRVHESEN